jgi:rsbT co-antagonist protein RsbR
MSTVEAATGAAVFASIAEHELARFWQVYQGHYDEIGDRAAELLRTIPEFAPFIDLVPPEAAATQRKVSREMLEQAIESRDWEAYVAHLIEQGRTYGEMGLSFGSWFRAVGSVRRILLPYLGEAYPADPVGHEEAILGMDAFMDAALSVIGTSYLIKKEATILDQQEAIRELSTPVLPVRDGLLILPVVGVVDSHRAYQLTYELLEAVRRTRSKVVVIDITGVPSVDSKVANHFIQTVDAAKLMGADAILTGLSPSIAKALVTLGVDLTKLRTVGDLQGGLALAEELLGYRVERLDGRPR